MENVASPAKAPWHLWVVGAVSLLWNAVGALDYTMTELGNRAYLESAGADEEALAYIRGFPAWAVAAWAVGVWFCFAGSLLLLFRSRHALPAFAISLLGIAIVTYYSYAFPRPAMFDGAANQLMNLALWAVTIFLTWYAWKMRGAGVLR